MNLSFKRIFAVVIRHLLALKSPFELFGHFYWIFLDIIIFGFMAKAMLSTNPSSFSAFISKITVWYVIPRGAITLAMTMFRDLSDACFVGLMATPLTLTEWFTAHIIMGITGSVIGLFIGYSCVQILFGFNPLALGWTIVPVCASLLISSWVLGIITLWILVNYGKKAITYVYAIPWAVIPFASVFYPITVLPHTVQTIAMYFPPYHVFHALDLFFAQQPNQMIYQAFLKSLMLNGIYFVIVVVIFIMLFRHKKKSGLTRLELEGWK